MDVNSSLHLSFVFCQLELDLKTTLASQLVLICDRRHRFVRRFSCNLDCGTMCSGATTNVRSCRYFQRLACIAPLVFSFASCGRNRDNSVESSDRFASSRRRAPRNLAAHLRYATTCSSCSSKSNWLFRIFRLAKSILNHSARSISGNSRILPDPRGHSIENVLLLTAAASKSLCTAHA